MKYFITGASGQLGSELQHQLSDAEIVATDVHNLDITDLSAALDAVAGSRPDVIINCAAYTSVNNCETDYAKAHMVNAIGARNMAFCAEKHNAKLVHISTDYVFDGRGSRDSLGNITPYREYDTPLPQNVYGKTKLAGEIFVRENCRKYFIMRTAWLYGLVGSNFVKTILRAAKQGKPLKIVNDQLGNPTSCAELSRAIIAVSQTDYYGVFHASCNGVCSRFDFASEFLKLANFDIEITPCATADFPSPAKRPAYSALDNMMLRSTIGDTFCDWQQAILEYITELRSASS
jgi:dTDP-4-dehydrorhamnose reductase